MNARVGFNQREFAERWGLHPKTLSRLTRTGVVRPSLRLGKLLRYRDQDILAADLTTRAKKLLAEALQERDGR